MKKYVKTVSTAVAVCLLCVALCACSAKLEAKVTADSLYGKVISIDAEEIELEVGAFSSMRRSNDGGIGGRVPHMDNDSLPSDMADASGKVGQKLTFTDVKRSDDAADSDGELTEQDNRESNGGMFGSEANVLSGKFTSSGVTVKANVADNVKVTNAQGKTAEYKVIAKGDVVLVEIKDDEIISIAITEEDEFSNMEMGDDIPMNGQKPSDLPNNFKIPSDSDGKTKPTTSDNTDAKDDKSSKNDKGSKNKDSSKINKTNKDDKKNDAAKSDDSRPPLIDSMKP